MKKILFIVISILIFNVVVAQNLVPNGSFEKHPTIDFRERHKAQPDDWQSSGKLCNCEYKENVSVQTHGFDEHTCLKSGAVDGCAMMKLGYTPKCKCSRNDDFSGSTSYLTSTLSQTLKVGKYYKVTYWTYYADKHNTKQDPAILDNLGFILTSKNPRLNNSCLIQTRAITSDNFQKDKWFKTEKIIVPTCELNYLTIGIFRNKDWTTYKNGNYHSTYYFIDNVSVVEVKKEDVDNSITSYNFCNKLPEPVAEVSKTDSLKTEKYNRHIYFATNESTPLNYTELDKIAAKIKLDKALIFLISGHTDNVGSDNETLSQQRVETVTKYFTEQHKIPKYRLITAYFGATKPIVPNDTEANRAKNRRVTVEELPLRKSHGIYRQALLELENGNTVEALKLFRGWEMNEKDNEKILAYFDIKTDDLRQDKRWSVIDKAIRKSYDKYVKPEYAFILDSLYCEDQKYRRLNTYVQDLAGYIKSVDTEDWEYPPITNIEWRMRDSLIYLRLEELLQQNGFPKQSEVGKRSAKTAAVILIHSHDTTALKKYLPIMFDYCKKDEAQFGYYAMMFDKLCVLQNKGQRYGTQYLSNPKNPSEMILAKLENPSKVNEARQEITLPPLSEEVIEEAMTE